MKRKLIIAVLTGVVLGYRAIPAAARGRTCAAIGRPKSTSHLALAGLRLGDISAFRGAISNWLDDPWKSPGGD